jgi:hypothetical protein
VIEKLADPRASLSDDGLKLMGSVSVREHQPARLGAAWQQWQRSTFARVRSSVHSPNRFRSTMRSERTLVN